MHSISELFCILQEDTDWEIEGDYSIYSATTFSLTKLQLNLNKDIASAF